MYVMLPKPRRWLLVLLFPKLLDDVLQRLDDLVLLHAALVEAHTQVEQFRGRPERKRERLGAPRLRLRSGFAGFLARRSALACQTLDQRDHFIWVALPNYLQEQ